MEGLTLWIALTPEQFNDLNNGRDVHPDEYSHRFGLRKSPAEAVERAQLFMDWTPQGPKGLYHQKDFKVCQINISPLGYLRKMEDEVLVKSKPGEYRWQGKLNHEERDEQGNVLYCFSEVAAEII